MSKNEKGGTLRLSAWCDTFGMYGHCHTLLAVQSRSLKQSLRAKPTPINFLALTLSTRQRIKIFQVEKAYLVQMIEFIQSPKKQRWFGFVGGSAFISRITTPQRRDRGHPSQSTQGEGMTQHSQITMSQSYPSECLDVRVTLSWASWPFYRVAKVAHWPASNGRWVPEDDNVGIAESSRRLFRYLSCPTADFRFRGPRQQQ